MKKSFFYKFVVVFMVALMSFGFLSYFQVVPTATVEAATKARQVTGKGKTLSFQKGDTVLGYKIVINGKTYIDKVIKNAPYKGKVTDGVINPWSSEIKGKKVVKNSDITAPTPTPKPTPKPTVTPKPTPKPTVTPTPVPERKETGVNGQKDFKVGESAAGKLIIISINNVSYQYQDSYILNSPYAGTVYNGVVNPWEGEYKSLTKIVIATPTVTPTPTPSPTPTPPVRRATTTSNDILYFSKGESVYALDVYILDQSGTYYQHFQNTWIVNCPNNGYLQNGYVNPTSKDIPKGVHIYIY